MYYYYSYYDNFLGSVQKHDGVERASSEEPGIPSMILYGTSATIRIRKHSPIPSGIFAHCACVIEHMYGPEAS
jgi:hypothetical protein